MNQLKAFQFTVDLAEAREMEELPGNPLGLEHLRDMLAKVSQEEFASDKLGRWLGWAQCAVVAQGIATMEEMRQINIDAKGE